MLWEVNDLKTNVCLYVAMWSVVEAAYLLVPERGGKSSQTHCNHVIC